MKKSFELLIWISVICTGAGLILLFYSVSFGNSLALSWLDEQGGSDPQQYQIVMESYINSFIACGSILFAFGLVLGGLGYFSFLTSHEEEKKSHLIK
ncbi:hypothetical protein [Peribacillus sp. SCS-37]|uniref:hypothetical protein n=1 Tax=Paraperibacillus esterisolvens TaxID=3115296 RepID=UPI0039065DDA